MSDKLSIKIDWSTNAPSMKGPLNLVLAGITAQHEAFLAQLDSPEHAEQFSNCTYVYSGCGSCADGGALVEAYCTAGGSQPDYSWCEPC